VNHSARTKDNFHRKEGDDVTRVTIDNDESFESALRRFNKMVQGDRVLSEVRRRRFYEKPSIVDKRKRAAKLRKSRRQTSKLLQNES
jgi:small subunit ribosomal protein S21